MNTNSVQSVSNGSSSQRPATKLKSCPPSAKRTKPLARKNFAGIVCKRFEFRLMPVVQTRGFSPASNPEQQFRIDPTALGANDRRCRIHFAQLRLERPDLHRLDKVDLVQKQNVRTFDLQSRGVPDFGEANNHVGVDN